jgi:hypothetical protein
MRTICAAFLRASHLGFRAFWKKGAAARTSLWTWKILESGSLPTLTSTILPLILNTVSGRVLKRTMSRVTYTGIKMLPHAFSSALTRF